MNDVSPYIPELWAPKLREWFLTSWKNSPMSMAVAMERHLHVIRECDDTIGVYRWLKGVWCKLTKHNDVPMFEGIHHTGFICSKCYREIENEHYRSN